MSETDIDGDAAAFLFFQAVGIDAGERFDERGLAVIDVAGRADDDTFHACSYLNGPGGGIPGLLRTHRRRRLALHRGKTARSQMDAADQRAQTALRSGRRPGREPAQLL